ncbi:MAG: hypothetical protein EOO99_06955 [Pedobacter sp.]|nr:MAG: hypothetical protein EOO99_06955 [Pedobacter sp.]
MKNKLLLLCLIFFTSMSYGQGINQGLRVSSDPALIRSLSSAGEEITGNPFLFDDWKNVTIIFTDGSFQNMQADIKYNLIAHEILVKINGQDGVFREDIKEFILKEGEKIHVYRKGFTGSGLRNNAFVEVLADGSIIFLKQTEKIIIESKGYNTAGVEKKVGESIRYYFVKDGVVKEIKLNEKAIFEYLNSPEAEAYVKANKLNLKKESDVASLLRNVIK